MRKSSLVKAMACFMAATMAVTCVPGANVTNGISIVAEAAAVEPAASFTFGNNGLKDSVSGKEATLTGAKDNAAATVQNASYASNGALLLDGTYGIKLPDEAAPKGDTYTITYTAKVNESTAYTPQIWVYDKADFNSFINIGRGWQGEGGFMAWTHTNADGYGDSVGGAIQPVGETHNYTVVVEGKKISIYCDGRLYSTDENSKYINGDNSNIYIGVNRWDAAFKGEISNLNIYNAALTEADIRANLGLLPALPGKVSYDEDEKAYFVYASDLVNGAFPLNKMFSEDALGTTKTIPLASTGAEGSVTINGITYKFQLVAGNALKSFTVANDNIKVRVGDSFDVVSYLTGQQEGVRVADITNTTAGTFTAANAATAAAKYTTTLTFASDFEQMSNDFGICFAPDSSHQVLESITDNTTGKTTSLTETVGATDNSTGWWTAWSDFIQLDKENFDITIKFKNYGTAINNWNNWNLVFSNKQSVPKPEEDPTYHEYGVLRSDNFGWGNEITERTSESFEGYDDAKWSWFREVMNGADITMTIKKTGSNQLQVISDVYPADKAVEIGKAVRSGANKNTVTQTVKTLLAGTGTLIVSGAGIQKTVNYTAVDNICKSLTAVVNRTGTNMAVNTAVGVTAVAQGIDSDVLVSGDISLVNYDKTALRVVEDAEGNPVVTSEKENGISRATYTFIPLIVTESAITFKCGTETATATISAVKAGTIPSINGSTGDNTKPTDPDDNKDDNNTQNPSDDNNNTSDDKNNTTTTKKKAKITSVKAKRSKKNIVTVSGTVLKKATVKVTAKGKTLKTTANKKGKFSVSFSKKVSKKIKKNTTIKVVVTKSGYKKNTKNIKVK